MMSCREVAERSSAYLEQELSLAGRISLRLHLLLCGTCRRLVGGMRTLLRSSALLRGSGTQEEHYTEVADQLMAGLRADPAGGSDPARDAKD